MTENNNTDNGEMEGFKQWLQDNLRIIISILIVLVLAGGIYSYSKRSEVPMVVSDTATDEESEKGTDEDKLLNELDDFLKDKPENTDTKTSDSKDSSKDSTDEKATPVQTSKDTGEAFIEVAKSGEGLTHLARHALSDYLTTNPDSALTSEHRIYIEDYLRKKASHTGGINVGTEVSFSKDLIRDAISSASKLTDSQLQNLKKYSMRVSFT